MNVERVAVAEYWRQQGLRSMTANALAKAGIDDLDKLAARKAHVYSVGKKGIADICALVAKHRPAHGSGEHMAFLEGFSDADLVMEMLRRGYRVDRPNGVTNS